MWFHLQYVTDASSTRTPSKKRDFENMHRSRKSSEMEIEKMPSNHLKVTGPVLAHSESKMSQESYSLVAPRTGVPVSREYEKMISGSPFRILQCPELQAKKLQARRFCAKYNVDDLVMNDASMPLDKLFQALRKERERLLRTIIGKVGESPVIEPPFHFQYGFNIMIGDRFYANVNLRISDSGMVTIGDRVMIGPNVTIVTEGHDKDVQSRRDGTVYAKPVSIGDDCWIGVGTTILPGVSIGKGTTIGAGSVVTRDIPPFSVAWGVPARVVDRVKDPDAE
ncbi:hypothetical protein VTN77DRAFT_6734 [Rasamsonia byssochlamydoides]|uniref:uncharacterized protein n=1 Tax=Rasamsonia byssochlamydoides TaxID=89139 RepID=UPI0037430357